MKASIEQLLMEEIPDALVLLNADGKVAYWNRGAETIFGFSRDDTVGLLLSETIVPSTHVAEENRLFQETLKTGHSTYEAIRRTRSGSFVYVDISNKVLRDAKGNIEYVLSCKKDVTDIKVLRDAKLIEARFHDLLESMPDGIVMANPMGRIVLANSQAEQLFGYEHGELSGKPIETLLPRRFRNAHIGHRSNYFSQPRTRSMGAGLELFGLRKDGIEFPVEISLSPLEIDEGTLVMSAIRDISDRKRIENVLHEQNIELHKAAEAKNRFLATMSHELRTPLNAIIGFTGTLLMKLPGPLTNDQEKQLVTIKSSAHHLLSLINDLLDLAKIESGKVEINLEPVSCAEIIADVAASLRPLAEKKGLAFDTDISAGDAVIQTDRRTLSQILINLANNAIKFTDHGSVVIALVKRIEEGRSVHEIRVTDTGCGIKAEHHAKLFHAFTQIDSSTTRRYEGTGLGLHLSQKLATLVGIHIAFTSEFGKGSVFSAVLPPKQDSEP